MIDPGTILAVACAVLILLLLGIVVAWTGPPGGCDGCGADIGHGCYDYEGGRYCRRCAEEIGLPPYQ